MRLKSFQAKSMAEAMRQIRDTLGEDAIIVTTREEPSGWVRITAAVEQINPVPESATGGLVKEETYTDPEIIVEAVTDTLLRHRVPASVSDRVISAAMTADARDAQSALASALGKTFSFAPAEHGKPILLAGPPGAGKTLMTAKMAARAVLEGRRPAVITTDIARAGGVEQLSAFLNILDLPLLQAEDPKSLQKALQSAKGASDIIVDTGGLNPFDPQEMKALARLMAAGDMESALVLGAGIDAEEAAEMALTFEVLGIHHLIPTRLDFARRLGGLLSAAERAGLTFGIASNTPQVAHGIMQVTPDALAGLLMPHLPRQDTVKDKGRETVKRGRP